MRKVLRGYAKVKDGNLILIGTIPLPYSKYKPSPRERKNKRHLVRQGATIFKKELVNRNCRKYARKFRAYLRPQSAPSFLSYRLDAAPSLELARSARSPPGRAEAPARPRALLIGPPPQTHSAGCWSIHQSISDFGAVGRLQNETWAAVSRP